MGRTTDRCLLFICAGGTAEKQRPAEADLSSGGVTTIDTPNENARKALERGMSHAPAMAGFEEHSDEAPSLLGRGVAEPKQRCVLPGDISPSIPLSPSLQC